MNKSFKTTICLINVKELASKDYWFSGKNDPGKKPIPVFAKKSVLDFCPTVGETWKVEGHWAFSEKYGWQIHAEKVSLESPSGDLLVNFLSNHPSFKGIGSNRAINLWKAFGVGLYQIIDEADGDAIREKMPPADLPEAVLENIFKAWEKHKREINNVKFLQQHGFPRKLAKDIMYWDTAISKKTVKGVFQLEFAAKRLNKRLQQELLLSVNQTAIERISENPYLMLAFSSWNMVDKFAKRLGFKNNDYRRRMAAVYATLYEAYKNGHTCVSPEHLIQGLKKKIGGADKSQNYEDTIGDALKRRIYTSVIDDKTVFQAFGPRHMENTVKARIEILSDGKHKQSNLFQMDSKELDKHIADYEKKHNLTFHKNQRKAVCMAMTNNVSVMTGGAGVGKTTVIRCILSALDKCREAYLQMALAGRAAHQMRLTTERDAMTIAAFIYRTKQGTLKIAPTTRLIVDESSMLDLPASYEILTELHNDGKLLFVGDPYQLPPVGPGLVFNKLVDAKTIPSVELTHVHRQASDTGIPQIAYEIRNGRTVDFDAYKGPHKGVSFIECKTQNIPAQVRELYEDLGGFDRFEEVQVLAAQRGKDAGTTRINNVLKEVYQKTKQVGETNFKEGDSILYTANDYEREIWNGSLGKITTAFDSPIIQETKYGEKRIIALATFDGRQIELADTDFYRDVKHGFAVTIHKAQGSQFKRVIIPVQRKTWNLDLTMVYTALTRGVEQIVFVGERRAVSEAIAAGARSHQRNVALTFEKNIGSTFPEDA